MVSVEKNKAFITSFIVLIFVFLSFLLAVPIIDKTGKKIEAYKDSLILSLEKKLGIIVSYEKMSPSIIHSIKITNIAVFDTKDSSKLADIPYARVYFSFRSLVKGDFPKLIKSISINSLHIEYDAFLDSHVFENIQSLFANDTHQEEILERKDFFLPFTIHFNALSIAFKNSELEAFFTLKKLSLLPQDRYRATGYKTQGVVQIDFSNPDLVFLNGSKLDFNAQGSLASLLDFSFLQLRVTRFENSTFALYPFDLAIIQEKDSLLFSLLQNAGAIALKARYDLESKDIFASLKTSDFYPNKLIRIKDSHSSFQMLNTLRLSGDFSCTILNSDFNRISYTYDANVQVPDSLFPKGMSLLAQGDGDLSKITIQRLYAKGAFLELDFEGSYSFDTKKPTGFADVHKVLLPSKNTLSFELYIDGTRDGFMLFVPQLSFGEKSFTALELELIPKAESWDFSFLAYDYSHYEYMSNAEIQVSGSLLLEKKVFLQTNIAISNLFFDSVFTVLEYSLSEHKEVFALLKNQFATFLTSTELYVATDFSQFSYNIPYAIIANTAKDKELAVFSLGGNEGSLSLTQFDVLFGNQSLESTANFDFLPGFTDAFFAISLTFNSIPYDFQGSLVNKQNIYISGSYGLEALVYLSKDSLFSGRVNVNSFPFSIKDSIFTLSLDSTFYYNSFFDWYGDFSRFELSKTDGKDRLSPYLSMTGFVDTYGATMHSFRYSDKISSLDGHLLSSWSFLDGILNRADVNIDLKDVYEKETYALSFSIVNPLLIPMNSEIFFDETYVSSEVFIKNSPMERLVSQQNEENNFNMDVTALGSLKNPSISLHLYDSYLGIQGMRTMVSLNCLFENNSITIPEARIVSDLGTIENINAQFDFTRFSGTVEGTAIIKNLMNEEAQNPFSLSIDSENVESGTNTHTLVSFLHIPESYTIHLAIPQIREGSQKDDVFALSLIRSESQFGIQGGFKTQNTSISNPSIQGYFTDFGDILLKLEEDLPISVFAYGKVQNEALDIHFSDLIFNAESFQWLFDFGDFKVLQGIARGNFSIGGYIQDPEFSGLLTVEDFACEVPNYIPEIIRAENVSIVAEEKTIQIPDILALTKKGSCIVDIAFSFDKWLMDRLIIDLKTPIKETIFVDADFGLLTVQGNAACDLRLELTPVQFSIRGSIDAEDTLAKIYPSELISQSEENVSFDIITDLDIRIGMRSQVSLFLFRQINPIVRSLVSPNTRLHFVMNSRENTSHLEGDIVLKGGEVNIGRSFYIKEGKFSFEGNQETFDPIVNLIAEMRERDSTGEFVKITLSALNQRLSTFDYTLTSSPPKSEIEIMSLLGKTLVYDPTGSVGQDMLNIIGVGLDSFVQNTIMREAEDRLRDFFKLDILTLRTSMLQNAIKLYSEDNSEKSINPGNFLDDSSVYIGKYFGDVLYGDLFLHLNYVESKSEQNTLDGRLSIQPELGLEMEAPFATIRWGLAPDVESMQNLWVPYTSISLSWKILF